MGIFRNITFAFAFGVMSNLAAAEETTPEKNEAAEQFTEIILEGPITASLTQASKRSIVLECEGDGVNDVYVSASNRDLDISAEKPGCHIGIAMPQLTHIDVYEGATLSISAFKVPELEIWVGDEGSEVIATGLRVGDLRVDLRKSSRAMISGSSSSLEIMASDTAIADMNEFYTSGLADVFITDSATATLGNVGELDASCTDAAEFVIASFKRGRLDEDCLKNE